ncbi:sialidase family protein [Tunturibacter empetritectus]|uniref:Exo-alpha-sialidase n=1 Tax=Tunturiibacter lichenicola TaxID=2051959 RepID=A0A7W8JDY7_9BACT|nr:sialidase family protein [Edaphobacter lichenicola]MBB5346266.1 hypothetical protein [Edaphobacter lichenicola]
MPVYKSSDRGLTWKYLSEIDGNVGTPGALGKPDKGVYEPYFYQLDQERIGVMYSSEKYAAGAPAFSQIVSEKISSDKGRNWGKEIRVVADGRDNRPGMPVWTRMKNSDYIVVYEVCGPKNCQVHAKTSTNGTDWGPGLGSPVPLQRGAPYLLSLNDGSLIVTSNNHAVSMSLDYGNSWFQIDPAFPGSDDIATFSSLYQLDDHSILVLTGLSRDNGGRKIVARIGTLIPSKK